MLKKINFVTRTLVEQQEDIPGTRETVNFVSSEPTIQWVAIVLNTTGGSTVPPNTNVPSFDRTVTQGSQATLVIDVTAPTYLEASNFIPPRGTSLDLIVQCPSSKKPP